MNGDCWRLLVFVLGVLLLASPARSPAEPLPAEVEAIRAEREQQRAALDRIRRKVEALRQTEERPARAGPKPNASAPAVREEQRPPDAERHPREWRKDIEELHFWPEVRTGARAALPWLAVLYGAFFLFLLFPPYRIYLEYWLTHPESRTHPLLIGSSALCLSGSLWLLHRGGVESDPETLLALGGSGLFFWFWVPGLLGRFLVFLHSLFVPHPMEAVFHRVLRGEPISREEAARVAETLYNAKRDGIPADWRVRSRIWRLERLATLVGKEKVVTDTISDHILNQYRTGRRN